MTLTSTKGAPSPAFTEAMTLALTILGTAMVYLDQSALNIALPTLQKDLRADLGGLQWITDIYILIMAALMLVGGALGDRHGRVRVFVIGMLLFVGASIVAGLATSLEMLVAARAAQGLGGALVLPGSFAIVNATFPAERRGQAMGIWGTFSPLITLSGPVLGGWLVDNLSWRAVFFLNVPLGVFAYLASRYVPENRDEQATGPLDWPGVFTALLGLGAVLFGLIEGAHLGWGHPWVVGALVLGAAGLAAFVFVEARSPAPLLPLSAFRNRTFAGINVLTLIFYLALGGIFFLLTLNFQQVQNYSPTKAGAAQLPIPILLFLMANPVGRLSDRVDPRILIAAGVLFNCVGLWLFSLPGIDVNYWTSFFVAQVVFGVGLGLLVVPLTSVAIGALEKRYSGVASGFNTSITRVGLMLAVAIFGAVMLSGFRDGLTVRTADLPLDPALRVQLLAEARNLGETEPPAGLGAETTLAVQTAIRLAFVDGFRQVMRLSIVIALLGLVTWLALVWKEPQTVRQGQTATTQVSSAEQ